MHDFSFGIWVTLALTLSLGFLFGFLISHIRFSRRYLSALQAQAFSEARFTELERHQDSAQTALRSELLALSQNLVESGGRVWAHQNEEKLGVMLGPLHTRLRDFQARLEEGHQKEAVQQALLKQEVETLARAGLKLSEESRRLTNALGTQSKAQGLLGEIILESLLAQAGLEEGRDFEIQQRGQDPMGRILQPDILVHLPGERDLVIDAKVSLTSFERWRHSSTDEDADLHLKAHLQSVKRHISGLSEKRYHDMAGLRTLDFVILFMPLEGAYQAALSADPGLHQLAWEKNLILLPPSGLVASLRMVAGLWQGELRQRHAQELARLAGGLHDKLVAFTEDWDRCEKSLTSAMEAWQTARKRLWSGKTGASATLERMRALGSAPAKEFPVTWRHNETEVTD
jgi:DNA recombination protein RmuC